MKTKMLFCILFIISTCLFSTIINVPTDVPTIQAGIDVAATADTVLVAEGTYFENIDFIGKAITVASNFIIDGDETYIENTIINGSTPIDPDFGSCVRFMSGETPNSILTGFTLTGGSGTYYPSWGTIGGGICIEGSSPTITNNFVTGNSANYDGGLGCSYGSNPRIIDNVFSANSAETEIGGLDFYDNCNPYVEGNLIKNNIASTNMGAINLYNSSGTFKNNIIMDNQAGGFAAGIHIWNNSSADFVNCIISGNTAFGNSGAFYISNSEVTIINCDIIGNTSGNNGGGIYVTAGSGITIINTIVEGNEAADGSGIYFDNTGDVDIQFCDFLNGGNDFDGPSIPTDLGVITGVNIYGTPCDIFFNIFEDPLFAGTGDDPFALLEGSPCIDAGIMDTTGLNLPEYDLIGNPRIVDGRGDSFTCIDIGAYELPTPNIITQNQIPLSDLQLTNYPNPFNPTTTISFSVTQTSSFVTLDIYNIKGQKVKQLVSDQLSAGQHSVIWQGIDDNNKPVSSGIYFYKLKTGDFEKTKKMILMK